MCVALPNVKYCCCCIKLWIGCVIIGVITLLEGVLVMTGVLNGKRSSRMELDNIIEGVMLVALGAMVLLGVWRKMAVLLNVPAIVLVIMLAVFPVLAALRGLTSAIDAELITALITFVLNVYFVIVLCSHAQELE